MVEILTLKTIVDATCEEVYAYHEKADAINRIFAPWEEVDLLHKPSGLEVGGVVHIQKMGHNILIKHTRCDKPYGFEDEQIVGFLPSFKHKHVFNKISETQTEIIDEIEYELPKGFFKKKIMGGFTKHAIKMFEYRHKIYEEDFRQFRLSKRKPLRILVSGSHGFVGNHLCMILNLFGDEVFKLVRKPSKDIRDIYWDPLEEKVNIQLLEGFDVVIHLAGESITTAWTEKNKKCIYDSRVNSTKLLTHVLNQLKSPPKLFLCASGCGFYGNREDEVLDESASKGTSFLSEVTQAWESRAKEFIKGRVILMRFGAVIGLKGGVLQKLLMPFKMGCGVIMGSGFQWISWISIDDLTYQILHILKDETLQGPVNFTAPHPVTAEEFSKTLGFLLKRPVFFRFPASLIKILLGKRGEELLLTSVKCVPKILIESGSVFSYPTLSEALKVYLGR